MTLKLFNVFNCPHLTPVAVRQLSVGNKSDWSARLVNQRSAINEFN